MLYRLKKSNGKFDRFEPVEFKDFSSFENKEKDLENLIATNILTVLFEEASLMPIHQERQWQAEGDIYALNENGDLIIFELKRCAAGEGAVHQVLRYAQEAGQWSYSQLEKKYQEYSGSNDSLIEAHKEAFNLEHALDVKGINRKQHLIIIGSAADNCLINSVDYWKEQGLSIEFLPYRVYKISGETYFEFFALPYDRHKNPSDAKGVLFDTNRSWNENAIWDMIENKKVAAYGDAKRFVEYIYPSDIVFFSHRWAGIVAAAKVKNGDIKAPDKSTLYRDVEFLTTVPQKNKPLKAMPFKKVSEVTGKSFFWARTIKVPYLTKEEADILVEELNKYLKENA